MFKTKISLLLIAVVLLNLDFLLSYSVLANDTKGVIVNNLNDPTFFPHASSPQCSIFSELAINTGIATLIAAIVLGVAIAIAGTVTTGVLTAVAIAGMIAAIATVWQAVGGWVTCIHSFVLHPVIHDHDGNLLDYKFKDEDGESIEVSTQYKECANKEYQKEVDYLDCLKDARHTQEQRNAQNISREILSTQTKAAKPEDYWWPKNSEWYSDYIRVCHRNPLSFGYFTTGGLKDEDFKPREKEINEKRIDGLHGNITQGPWNSVDGDLKCKSLRAGEGPRKIYGTGFKGVQRGDKLCVVLDSVRGVPSLYPRNVNIGCVKARPDPIAPMCSKSKARFKKRGVASSINEYRTLNNSIVKEMKKQEYSNLAEKMTVPGYSIENVGTNYRNVIRNMEKNGYLFDGYDNEMCLADGPKISKACYDRTASNSRALVPITSMVVECIQESLHDLVYRNESNKQTFLSTAQKTLKNAIRAALTLALTLFALKVVSGGVRNTQEMYILILKFALVIYFATGDVMSTYYGHLTRFSRGLQDIVINAASSQDGNNICNYSPSDEDNGKNVRYENGRAYLASWDRLDCRILFYFGAPLSGAVGKLSSAGVAVGAGIFAVASPIVLIVGGIFGAIFAGAQILVAIAALFMAVLMVMVIMWMCYVYILSLFALTVVVVISPLFIPMVLFQATKGYFDAWVRELITYSLYPVMLFSFLSFMFIACDKVFFKDLKFKVVNEGDKKPVWFELEDRNACDKDREDPPLACVLQNYEFTKHSILGGLISWKSTTVNFHVHAVKELMKLALVLFLFYHFLQMLPQMAAELAGNYRAQLGHGGTPASMVNTAISWGKMAAGDAMTAASKLGSSIKNAGSSNTPRGGASGEESIKSSGG